MLLVAFVLILITILTIILIKKDKLPLKKTLVKPLIVVLLIEIVLTVFLYKKAKIAYQNKINNQEIQEDTTQKTSNIENVNSDTSQNSKDIEKVDNQQNSENFDISKTKTTQDINNELEATRIILQLLQNKYDELEKNRLETQDITPNQEANVYEQIIDLTEDIKEFDSKVNLLWKPDYRKREIAKKIQILLKGIGYYRGDINSSVDDAYEAIIKYKKRKGLRNRGYLTPRVLESILIDYYRQR